MAINVGREIVITDDKIFKIGYGEPEMPLNGMIRYNHEENDFEFCIRGTWVSSGIQIHPLYTKIRYNPDIPDFEFLVDGEWVERCSCPCPEPLPCPECPEVVCPEPDPCPECPDYYIGASHRIRHFVLREPNWWTTFASGGRGVTYDMWDLSQLPNGSKIDFKFHAHLYPDRFMIEYPMGTQIYDSGWRSTDPTNEKIDHRLYSPEINYPGEEWLYELFTKENQTIARVIVYGSENGSTEWMYALRYKHESVSETVSIIHPEEYDY